MPAEFMPNAQSFLLKVKGDSMINAGIFDGDQVLVKQQSSAENGDMVVALVEDAATVKTFIKKTATIVFSRKMMRWTRFSFMEIFRSLAKYLAYFVFIINQIKQKESPEAVGFHPQHPGIHLFIRNYFYKPQDSQESLPAEYFRL